MLQVYLGGSLYYRRVKAIGIVTQTNYFNLAVRERRAMR